MEMKEEGKVAHNLYWCFVVGVCFLIQALYSLMEGTMGVVQLELVPALQLHTVMVTAMTVSQFAISMLFSLPCGMLFGRFGQRPFLFLGSLLVGIGYLSSAFVKVSELLLLTYSIVIGLGMSSFQIAALYTIQRYFNKWRSLAQGVIMAGQSFGQFIWPPITEILMSYYGWRGCFMFLAGFGLHGCVCAMLLPNKREDVENKQNEISENPHGSIKPQLKERFSNINRYVIVALIGILFETVGHHIPLIWLPTIGVKNIGVSPQAAAFLVSIYAISSGISRLGIGALGDVKGVCKYRSVVMSICLLGTGITSMLLIIVDDYISLVLYSVFQGIFSGGFVTLVCTVVTDLGGQENSALLNGLVLCQVGLSVLLANPFTGWLISLPGGLAKAVLICGGLQVFGGVLVFPFMVIASLKRTGIYSLHL